MTSFIVLATQRTGSTWLIEMLDSHPQVHAYSELFLQADQEYPRFGHQGMRLFDAWRRDDFRPEAIQIRDYLAIVFGSGAHAAGFKLMYTQLTARESLADLLRDCAVKVIHLRRVNTFRLLLSRDVAVQRSSFHREPGQSDEAEPVEVATHDLIARLETVRREQRSGHHLVEELGLEALELSYEELLARPAEIQRAFAFLGVDTGATTVSRTQRVLPARLDQVVANLSDVAAALRGTRYEGCLAEDYPQLAGEKR